MKNTQQLLITATVVFGSCINADLDKGAVFMETGKDYPVYGGNKAGGWYIAFKLKNN